MDQEGHFLLEGASNVRDCLRPLRAGASTPRRVLRSGNLDRLSPEGRRRFGELGIAVVIDLRGKVEAAEAPELEGTTRVHLPIEPTVVAELTQQQVAGTLSVASAIQVMERTYRDYIVDNASVFAGLLHHVLAAHRRSVLFHCAAGKDRTGVAAALVLAALGVPRAAILEDYLLSNRFFRPSEPRNTHGFPDDVLDAIVKVRASYLDAAFRAMTEGWGGAEAYLENALGIGMSERAALRQALA